MARAILKKDFKDGDKLYGQQLNNNFGTIEAALDAMNKIAWQDDPDESVTAFRGTTEQIQSQPIIDGQLLYDISTGETYTDYNGERVSTGSGNAIHIGADTPENEATQLWIDPTEDIQSATEIESGSNENGNWVKYSDGTMIVSNSKEFSGVPSNQTYWTDYYRTDETLNMNFPETFIEIPSITMNFVDISGGALCLRRNGPNYVSTTNTGNFAIIYTKGAGTGNKRFEVSYVAIGRWK